MTEHERLILLALSEVGLKINELHNKYRDEQGVRLGLAMATQIILEYGYGIVDKAAADGVPRSRPKLRIVE